MTAVDCMRPLRSLQELRLYWELFVQFTPKYITDWAGMTREWNARATLAAQAEGVFCQVSPKAEWHLKAFDKGFNKMFAMRDATALSDALQAVAHQRAAVDNTVQLPMVQPLQHQDLEVQLQHFEQVQHKPEDVLQTQEQEVQQQHGPLQRLMMGQQANQQVKYQWVPQQQGPDIQVKVPAFKPTTASTGRQRATIPSGSGQGSGKGGLGVARSCVACFARWSVKKPRCGVGKCLARITPKPGPGCADVCPYKKGAN
jgi:hypothetical protein